MKTFFSNFEDVFGRHNAVAINFQSESEPKIEISSGISKITAKSSLSFLNPYNNDYETVQLSCNFSANIEFALLENFVLAGQVSDIKLAITDMKVYFLAETTIEKL